MPVLNEAVRVTAALRHLRAELPAAEVIVVDGGSRDGTPDLVAAVPGVRLLQSPRGRAIQMNRGAREARGGTLLFLHVDTRLPDGAGQAIEAALRDPGTAAGRFEIRFDAEGPAFRMIAFLMNWRSRLSAIATGDQALFLRREAFEAVGGYPDIPLMEDIEISRRLKRHGRLACLPRAVTTSARKWQQEGLARTVLLMWTLRFLYFAGVDPHRLHRWYYREPPAQT